LILALELAVNEDELKQRTKQFAMRVFRLVSALPTNAVGRTIGNQLVRSGSSVGANYRAACRGRSRADFISKLGIVVEEVDESGYWLELIIESGLLRKVLVQPLLTEANELLAIFVASHKSACLRPRDRMPSRGAESASENDGVIKNQKSKIKNRGV
jgi:four helix bundle protein